MANEYWFVQTAGGNDTNGGGGDASRGDDLSAYMLSNGGALKFAVGATYTHSDTTIAIGDGFEAGLDGLYAYVSNGTWTDWVKVASSTADTIVLESAPSGAVADSNNDVMVKVGGALATLRAAVGNGASSIVPSSSGAAENDSRKVFIKSDQDLSDGTLNWIVTGDIGRNNDISLIGYHTTLWDMFRSGDHYGEYVELDGDDSLADHIITMTGDVHNIRFYNIDIHGATGNAINFVDAIGSAPNGIYFDNCRVYDVNYGIRTEDWSSDNVCIMSDCDFGNQGTITSGNFSHQNGMLVAINCNFKVADTKKGFSSGGTGGQALIIINSLIDGGDIAAQIAANFGVVINNTFVNQTSTSIRLSDVKACAYVVNNECQLVAAADNGIIFNGADKGTIMHEDYNNFYSDAGPLTVVIRDQAGTGAISVSTHDIEVDPQFVDPANGDYRVQNLDVLLGGKPDVHGRATVIGAVGVPTHGVNEVYGDQNQLYGFNNVQY